LETFSSRLLNFQAHYKKVAKLFKWKFTKDDMKNILCEISYKNNNLEKMVA
tara:strand:- start:416 stop:568 length:153 start_codon:yes stop_codon:yes gene_type:complete